MAEVTVSSRHQIVIPQEARHALGLKAGDKLMVVVRGKRVLLLQEPASYRAAIRGIAKAAFPPDYLKKERQSWR